MVKTTYLQMFARPERVVPPPREGLAVVHARRPTVAYYRFLYNTVGKDYHWFSRGKLSDAELSATIQTPLNEVHVLHVDGTPAGAPCRMTTMTLHPKPIFRSDKRASMSAHLQPLARIARTT